MLEEEVSIPIFETLTAKVGCTWVGRGYLGDSIPIFEAFASSLIEGWNEVTVLKELDHSELMSGWMRGLSSG